MQGCSIMDQRIPYPNRNMPICLYTGRRYLNGGGEVGGEVGGKAQPADATLIKRRQPGAYIYRLGRGHRLDSCRATIGLKVHKNENFFGFDFEFCPISLLVMHK
jgi:hypothetical protein